jgi:GxxExxY protein
VRSFDCARASTTESQRAPRRTETGDEEKNRERGFLFGNGRRDIRGGLVQRNGSWVNEITTYLENAEMEEKNEQGRIGVESGKDPLSGEVIAAAIEVHRALGPGLLESAYRDCMEFELKERGLFVAREVVLPIRYKKLVLKAAYRLDLVVEKQLIVELKAVEKVVWIHEAQLLTYLKLSGIKRGLLLNFNVPLLKEGIKRMVC